MMGTTLEDSQINVLNRMVHRHGQVFLAPDDLKGVKSDPNMFPVAVLFKYRKELEKPTLKEGFRSIKIEPFVRKWPDDYVNKAAIFDYDGTLRDVPAGAKYKFPTKPEEVMLLSGRKEALEGIKANGYLLLGVSNQSGIARNQVTKDNAIKCFERTNELLGLEIDYVFCEHNIPPICYCRKPQSGIGVHLIHKYKLNPKECIFVGDQTTDKTFAERLGMKYYDQADFFDLNADFKYIDLEPK
jgi:HAD superfamily hydrolase (TIGR01662 family)